MHEPSLFLGVHTLESACGHTFEARLRSHDIEAYRNEKLVGTMFATRGSWPYY